MKKKVLAIVLAAAMLVMFTACNSGTSSSSTPASGGTSEPASSTSTGGGDVDLPEYNWNIGTMFFDPASAPDFNTEGMALVRFQELLEEKSGGALNVTIHWGSVLGGMDDMFDMLRTNDLDLAYSTGASSGDQRYGIFNMPGLITSYEMANDLMGTKDSELQKVYQRICEENNTRVLSGTVGTLRQVYNSKKEVKVPADMDGLLIRAYNDNTVTTYWDGLCNTTILPMTELYTALQLGTVDAFEHGPFSAISNGLTEVVSHCTVINWQWQTMPNFMIGLDLYNDLEPEVVAVLEEAAQEAQDYYYELMNVDTDAAYEYMEENGVAVYFPTADEQKEWDDYGASLYPQFEEAYGAELMEEVVGIVDAYKAKNA